MKNKSHRKLKTAILVTLSILLLLTSTLFGTLYYLAGRINIEKREEFTEDVSFEPEINEEGFEEVESIELPESSLDIMSDKNIINILLIGVDSSLSKNRGSRSDTMMILSIDKKHKKLKITSLLRDLYVEIPGRGGDRLNHSHAYGGANLLIKTIEHNFKVKINKYVRVNFDTFAQIIDKLGGIDIKLTSAESSMVPGTSSGLNHLNGKQATAYSRIRKIDSDFNRTSRQRKVMEMVLEKLKTMDIATLTTIMHDILPLVATDYTQSEIVGLILQSPALLSYPSEELFLPKRNNYRGVFIRGMAVLVTDLPAAAKDLQSFIYKN